MKDPSVLSVFIGVYQWSISKKRFLPGARNIASPYSIHIRRNLQFKIKILKIGSEIPRIEFLRIPDFTTSYHFTKLLIQIFPFYSLLSSSSWWLNVKLCRIGRVIYGSTPNAPKFTG
ncbi:hypothetical protein FIS3754_10430 [Fischerella sp. NIES-3754]|nr:hypothetical protein FIS3754_10430 [Fischerella sp. NIES-3754]